MERFAIKIDKSLRANLYKICRLCGIDNPDKVKVRDDANIVNLEDGEPELWKKVFDCIGLMITKDDKMPQFMCTLCVDKINDFFEFREMCYATDGQTRKLLGIKGEPKAKIPAAVPSTSVDLKTEDIKEPIPEVIPQRASRKRRNADMEVTKDIKTDITDDIKPSTANISSSASKKKRIKLSNTAETETKIEPGTKPGPASKSTPINAKKEPATKVTPKAEPPAKIALSKKRLKAEPIPIVKENKKEIKNAKITKLMKKKLKVEIAPVVVPVPVPEPQQPSKKKKVELIKLKKLPQVIVKAEKLKRGMLDTKIKEETPVATQNPNPAPAPSSKTKPKTKEKCTICNEGFVNKVHLDKHVKATHIPTVQRYHCVHCNETLKKNMEIKNHNLWHKLSKTPFKCGKCSETSCSIYTYTKHIRDCNQIAYLDSHIPDWHCPDCSGNYETTYLFNIHSCVSKGLVCPGCEKSLKWKEDYFKHIPTCAEAFQRIPPYMTSNIQVKNEAELPTSPVPPLTTLALPTTTITSVTVQSTPSTRVTPPQLDSTQCVVIPGNISLHEEPGSSSPSKTSRKGKRITKKDLKRFDKLLKSTMTTLVSIKHEPPQGEEAAVVEGEQLSSSEVRELSEPPPPDSPPGSPMPCGGDDFHHNGDDTDSADEQTPTKPVGTIKQEIIDEGYRDLYNNIEVNIKHEIEVNKNTAEESPQKNAVEPLVVSEESALAPKPILKLKITKEHGTLNSILMDSPKSEKKKKKKKRKEDRTKSPEKEEHTVADDTLAPTAADVMVANETPVETDVAVEIKVPINLSTPLVSNKPVVSESEEEPPMPLPEIIQIKKEINVPEVDEVDEMASNQNTPSIIAASSGSLQISCVSEGVIFHRPDENEEEMPQETPCPVMEQANITSEESANITSEEYANITSEESANIISEESANITSEESANWVEPIPSMEICISLKEPTSPSVDVASSMQYAPNQETDEEIDIKPRLEDLIPMLQIASVTSGAEIIEKPIKKPVKRKRRPVVAKSDPIPKIVSVSSGSEVTSYHPESDFPSVDRQDSSEKISENNENVFDFSKIKIKEEIVDPGYDEERSVTPQEHEEDTEEAEAEEDTEEVEEEAEEEQEVEEDVQLEPVISKKQAEENAYIANIDFNNLTIKQEKEYIDDGLENSAAYAEDEQDDEEEEEDECSDNDSEEVSSDEDSEKSDSESEREYRDLPSEDDENNKNEEKLTIAPQMTPILDVKEKETPTSQAPLGLQILTVHSEFSCHQSSKKTESEEINSDDKLSLNPTTEPETTKGPVELDESQSRTNTDITEEVKKTYNCIEDQATPMEVDGECEPVIETTSIVEESVEAFDQIKPEIENVNIDGKSVEFVSDNESILENTNINEKSVEISEGGYEKPALETTIIDGESLQLTQSANDDTVRESSETTDVEMTFIDSADQASISQPNNLDHWENATEKNSMHVTEGNLESLKSEENSNKTTVNSFETNLENTDLPQVCDDLESKENEQIIHNACIYKEGQLVSTDLSTSAPSKEICLESSILGTSMVIDLDQRLYSEVPNVDLASSLLPPEGMDGTNIETQNVAEVTQAASKSEQPDIDMMLIDQCYNTALRSIDEASRHVDVRCVGAFGEATEQNDNVQQDSEFQEELPVVTRDGGMLSACTDISGVALTSQCPTQEVPLERLDPQERLDTHEILDTQDSCQNLVEANPYELPPVDDVQHSSSIISASEQSVICSHAPETLNSALSYSMHDHISYKQENQPTALPSLLENTLQTNSSLTSHHTLNAFENTNILMDLGNTVGNSISNVDLSSNHDRQEYNPNSQFRSESVFNIPPSRMELQQFNTPGSSYVAFNCNSDPSSFTDYQDLNPPTAGQLQTSLVQQPVVNQSSELSTNSLTNLSVLSEEVQNLLNEDTVAINNFEFNDSVLRARSSVAPPSNPVPIFNDFENLNEIAENNNNANIERELQDELGNALADAIADRSNDDDVDDNNVMNENRANFDIT